MRRIEVDTIPDPSLMVKIGSTSFTVAEAVAELVANSFDARKIGERMEIVVMVTPQEIQVIDNGKGMPLEVLREAIRLSVDMDRVTGNTNVRKGMFGMGMKTACASLGMFWSIVTRPIGSELEFEVNFDLDGIGRLSKDGKAVWKSTIVERERSSKGPLSNHEHGTAIIINHLRDPNPLPGSVLTQLGASYGPHIKDGDIITVNNEKASPRPFTLLKDTRVEIDEPCGKHRITGWVGLDSTTHNDDAFGLNLYRKGQLVSAWDKSWFRVHLMTSRVIGEINLDFVPPNFYKKGFETQSSEWKDAEKVMRKVLQPVVAASREVGKGKNDPMKFARAAKAMQRAMGKTVEIGTMMGIPENENGDGRSNDDTIGEDEESSDPDDLEVESRLIRMGQESIRICSILANLEDVALPWSYMYDEEEQELQAVINNESLLFQTSGDTELLTLFGLADCLVQFLIVEWKIEPERAWQIRNKWLHVSTSSI